MKKVIVLILAMGALMTSCGDDFLSKFPNTQVSEGNFYNRRSVVCCCKRLL